MLGRLGHHCLTKCALSGYHGGNGCGLMLVSEIVGGGGGAPMTEEGAEEVEGMELDEDAVEFAEGDAYGDVVGAWFDGPAPLRLRIGILGLMISSSPSSCTSGSGSESVSISGRGGNLNFLVNVRNGVTRREIIGVDNLEVSAVEYCRRRERG